MTTRDTYVPVAVSERSGSEESVHFGAVVALDRSGDIAFSRGDPAHVVYPRSANKPMQAVAMVRAGLALPPELLALVCSSHDGTVEHRAAATAILASVGLDERVLGNPPDLPLEPREAHAVLRDGGGPTRIAMTCSGKHSGMLATCVINGWPHDVSYLEPGHPLQLRITDTLAELSEEDAGRIGVDGCGAPAHMMSLVGLARCFRNIATGRAGASGDAVASAMRDHPAMVGGARRHDTQIMRHVTDSVAKGGAEGIFVVALPDGRTVALKISDGSDRARSAVVLAALAELGVDTTEAAPFVTEFVMGHGHPVGAVRSLLR